MDEATRQFVRDRAGSRCEYCQLPEAATPFLAFHTKHIIAVQHMGTDDRENLAMACERCNGYKGRNLTSIDPETGIVTRLLHPREDKRNEHFIWSHDGTIVGLTDIGRTTVRLLVMNDPSRVQLRHEFNAPPWLHRFPPQQDH